VRPRVLWLSNKALSWRDAGTTGTWLDAMASALVASGQVDLANIAPGPSSAVTRRDLGGFVQWLVPAKARGGGNGLPPAQHLRDIVAAIQYFAPDLVHVWGTEGYWGLLTARGVFPSPALLEMQGLKSAIAPVFVGGLSFAQQLASTGIKEIVRFCPMWRARARFARWAVFEREIILGHRFITAQSDWLQWQVQAINPTARVLRNDFLLRSPFYYADAWRPQESSRIFCSAAYSAPFKGIHTAVRALALLKPEHPTIELRVAGAIHRPGVRQEGYSRWLLREARRLGVEDSLCWLGPLTGDEIVREMQLAGAVLLPTFVEGYCLALAEAMVLGAPSVVSFVGGTSCLARDDESALFFPPGDVAACAAQIHRVLTQPELALRISANARRVGVTRNEPKRVIENQLKIYQEVIRACHN
jgi:glycosyltransferase involved in cell wall biosynthesis